MTSKPDHISQQDWDAVEVPELTDAQFTTARSFADDHPDLAEQIRSGRGPQKAPTKIRIGIRLDRDLVEHMRASGKGWQSRANKILREALDL